MRKNKGRTILCFRRAAFNVRNACSNVRFLLSERLESTFREVISVFMLRPAKTTTSYFDKADRSLHLST